MPDTEMILDRLSAIETDPLDVLDTQMEPATISCMLDLWDEPAFAFLHDIRADCFKEPYHICIVEEFLKHLEEYKLPPSRQGLKDRLFQLLVADDKGCAAANDLEAIINRTVKRTDTPLVLKRYNQWVEHRHKEEYEAKIFGALETGEMAGLIKLVAEYAAGPKAQEDEWQIITAGQLDQHKHQQEWLINGVLEARKPMLVAGPPKSCKTRTLVDMAVSLASGTDFLGSFQVTEPVKVLFVSAESGQDDIKQSQRAVCDSRGISVPDELLHWSFTRPKLSDEKTLASLRAKVLGVAYKVVIIDPLYLTLLAGNERASATNLYDMGSVLGGVAEAVGPETTLILCHHTKKTADDKLDIGAMSYTGVAEFCRQWLMLNRRAKFTNTCEHRLEFQTGGFGFGTRYVLDVDEGVTRDRWITRVENHRVEETIQVRTKADTDRQTALNTLVTAFGNEATKNQLREYLSWSGERITASLLSAIQNKEVSVCSKKASNGKSATYFSRV